MADIIRVKNWDRWQSYRTDRGQPPWIKLHRCIMRNQDWVALSDAQRGQLVSIWLLAADKKGEIPKDPEVIKKLCYMDEIPDIDLFIKHGFIEFDANMTPERRQHDQPDKIRDREEKRRTSPNTVDVDLAKFVLQGIRKINPEHKTPNMETWVNDCRKIREIDKRTSERIREVFTWANQDEFWCKNILSPAKLRKQFDTLVANMLAPKRSGSTERPPLQEFPDA